MHKKQIFKFKKKGYFNLIFILSIILLALFLEAAGPLYKNYKNGILAIIFMILLYSMANLSSNWVKILGNRVFVFLGNASYSIYLFQVAIYGIFQAYLKPHTNSYIYFYVSFVALITASCFIYYYVERLIQKKILEKYLN